MATGDQNDILARLKALIPPSWFGDNSTFRDAILSACAQALSWCYSLYLYAQLQTRIATATDGWLDMIAYDFFGDNYGRTAGQSDDVFRNAIKINLFRERGTRHSVQKILEDLTGNTPFIFEPQRPLDTGAYGAAVAVSRSANGSYVDTLGIVRYAAPNTARYDANPYSTSINGLMVEPASVNLMPQSSNVGASPWLFVAATSTSGFLAPDLTNSAAKINATATTGNHDVYQNITSTMSTGDTFTTSIYAKAGERGFLQIAWAAGATGLSGNFVNFDLINGIAMGNATSYSITALANGWFRCVASQIITGNATATKTVAFVLASSLSDSRLQSSTGTGTDGFYLWGAQVEMGAVATSLIPTVATTASRDADVPLNNMTTNSTFLGGYGLTGGYGSQLIPYQAFVTAYRSTGSGIPYVAGYSSTPSGYSIASRGEYASQSMLTGSVTDAQIYAAVASVKMEGTIVWVSIQSQPDPTKRRIGIDYTVGQSQIY